MGKRFSPPTFSFRALGFDSRLGNLCFSSIGTISYISFWSFTFRALVFESRLGNLCFSSIGTISYISFWSFTVHAWGWHPSLVVS